MAITIDGLTASLYVNGILREQITLTKEPPVITDGYNIGNDGRLVGAQYFKGTIYGVTLFDDIRSDEELALDAIKVLKDAEGVIYSVVFAKKKN